MDQLIYRLPRLYRWGVPAKLKALKHTHILNLKVIFYKSDLKKMKTSFCRFAYRVKKVVNKSYCLNLFSEK